MAQRRRLPPLKALKTFESAANHLNFTKAAEELCVTAAAVSYQIRLLESDLGTDLFVRLPRGLALTQEGRALQSVCNQAFGQLSETVDTIVSGAQREEIRVASLPHFSARILIPGREELQDKHPNVSLSVEHTLALPDFADGYDFSIQFGRGSWEGTTNEPLFYSPVTPACSPKLVEQVGLSHPSDLQNTTILLDDYSFHDMWIEWFKMNELSGWETLNYTKCNDIHALLNVAVAGYGVVLEPRFVIQDQLAAGSLVTPFDVSLKTYGYFLVYPSATLKRTAAKTFRDWLLAKVNAMNEAEDGEKGP